MGEGGEKFSILMGGGVVHSKVILVPQKMLNKTSNLKMAFCKAASSGCNQNPQRTFKAVITNLQLKKNQLLYRYYSKILIKDF